MYQRARLVQLAALELHCADLAVQDATCKHLLQSFFLPIDTDDDTGLLSLAVYPLRVVSVVWSPITT